MRPDWVLWTETSSVSTPASSFWAAECASSAARDSATANFQVLGALCELPSGLFHTGRHVAFGSVETRDLGGEQIAADFARLLLLNETSEFNTQLGNTRFSLDRGLLNILQGAFRFRGAGCVRRAPKLLAPVAGPVPLPAK